MLNAAARVVSDAKNFDRGLSTLLHDKLRWLDVPGCAFKLGLMTYHCLHGQAPRYPSPSTSPQPLKLHCDIDYVLQTNTGSSYRAVSSTSTAVWLFQLLVQQSGTHCQMNSEMWRVILTISNNFSKQSFSFSTSVTSALEVNLKQYALYKFTFYLLAYFT